MLSPIRSPAIRLLVAYAIASATVLHAIGCATTGSDGGQRRAGVAAPRPASINHLAFFKLKNPADAGELIADCDRLLGTLPMVVSYYCGRHLDTGRGERVDSNYDVGFYVGFASEADLAAYVAHPDHQRLVAQWQPRWEWIRVQDVLDSTRREPGPASRMRQ